MVKRGQRLAKKIRKIRKKKKWTQEKLATEAKVSVDIIRAIERKTKSLKIPNLFIAHDLIKALGGSVDSWLREI